MIEYPLFLHIFGSVTSVNYCLSFNNILHFDEECDVVVYTQRLKQHINILKDSIRLVSILHVNKLSKFIM